MTNNNSKEKLTFKADSSASFGHWSLRATVWINETGQAVGVSKRIARRDGGFIPLGVFRGVMSALARNTTASDKTNQSALVEGRRDTVMV